MYPLVVIIGPTGVGKTALGIALAQTIGGEIISGDSVQVYQKLDIGSAKPTAEELQLVPHHLIDCLDPTEPFTAAQFKSLATSLIAEIRGRGHIPIVVGGTGLYIRSLLDPYDFSQHGSEEIRSKWKEFAILHGNEALHRELEKQDPVTAEQLHPNNVLRIIRALEVFELTGKTLSSQRQFRDDEYQPLDPAIVYIGLTAARDVIYDRINQRCVTMLKQGLIEETLALLKDGYAPTLKPLQSIGYRHAIWFLKGRVTQPEMLRLLQRDTRHFAKRQFTWFRRDPRISWYDISLQLNEILKIVVQTCRACETRVI
ncbi:tRNA (adenosine(37)-N6)-dimethylallyltransferase MiaA [Desulfosporosinus sp. BICA1-9]|uniref:tRNA (adenosine(37)-N6)-dimethylallyltransferase MiaA n=1 Tax=Desulfosporosinus sp. BICA1-9 TaxID=1531958 RepID=UPI00054B4DC0|nr:tRNA (adenosine(37)-N6)-dimethylallyltransferase MiaA [Desulfosporosinus sp. BICA1-9]KJS88497.1 MAG: tRNA dimethylallyltransferase [Desulfosporosinus sp. BICA1-9]HBW34655.1 tRNA (adenosine(37)-N6)-dimethylallyltransferase MiaA [Desulfosporosinus sp.]